MRTLPVTADALAASTDLRAVHVVALAHPDAEVVARARKREAELALAHDAASPGQLPLAVVTAFRAAYRANLNDDRSSTTLAEGRVLPVTSPEAFALLKSGAAVDRKALFAAKARIAFPANVEVLQTVQREAGPHWAAEQAKPFGGLDAIRRQLDAYEATIRPAYERELAELRDLGSVAPDALVPIWEAPRLRALAQSRGMEERGDIPLRAALEAIRELLFFLGASRVEMRTEETWGGIPFLVWTVVHGAAVGEVWLDLYDREAGANKPLRGITSRFRTRAADTMGGAYVSVRLPLATASISWAQMVTLCHEMGHGVHESLTPGTDEAAQHYAEVPSTLLEQLVQQPAVACAIGLGAYVGTALPSTDGHQVMKDLQVARYALALFSGDGGVPALTGVLPGYSADGLDLHEETATPALVTLQSAYYLYILCDAVVAGLAPKIEARDPHALAQFWAFVCRDDLALICA